MSITASIVSTAATAASTYQSYEAGKSQKKAAKKAEKSSILAQAEEKKKELARQNAQQAGGYRGTLGAGSSALSGE